ncbi:aminodeoxychorismate lyase [Pseudohongiella nitratireducens]|uniref:Aminodeoxychorismate lyase n=1 Tax=Pseudohongiella nitratireducens TaxID=1768907 RepID=A0A916VJT3_9GAMM|nr:aminodeoxychorismate lyase [Pseudohongiella nitratireducens]MDF1623911.1 aminodeoxychorismate lyase [Pseudohongiella nitratireducens]GFZ82428.1 aminodeoxychorismate lyase [Pseudohongiella nitratireducens]
MTRRGWQSLTFIDGEQSDSLPVTDRATQYGDGLFETMRWNGSELLLLDAHLQRLERGCQRLKLPLSLSHLCKQVDLFTTELKKQGCPAAVVKLIVSRGSGGRGYLPPEPAIPRLILQSHPLPDALERLSLDGIAALQSTIPITENPLLAGIKHLNRLDSVLASQELSALRHSHPQYADLSEALLCDAGGAFVEGSRSNIFAVVDGILMTPELSRSGVAGIMRDALLAKCQQTGIAFSIGTLPLDKIIAASELFICNSVIGIQPVHTLYLQRTGVAEACEAHDIVAEAAPGSVTTQLTRQLTFTERSVTARCQALIGEFCGNSS